jgi:hemerythrin-like metal-binding protein
VRTFAWDSRFETGLSTVDAQHQRLVELVNETVLRYEQGANVIADVVDALRDYAGYHFGDEERLMRDHGLADAHVAAHQQAHAAFVAQLDVMAHWLRDDDREAIGALAEFVTSWLVHHILGQDQVMARQVEAIAAGMAAGEAYQKFESEPGGPAGILLAALHGLFRRLAATAAELQNVNRELETRVAERTRSLAVANQALRNEHEAQKALVRQLSRTQDELVQAQKLAAVGQLAAGVAHEINNPLGFVTSNIATLAHYVRDLMELLDEHHRLAEAVDIPPQALVHVMAARQRIDLDYLRTDVDALLAECREGLLRVTQIVQDLQDFAAHDGEWRPTDLNEVVEGALRRVWGEVDGAADVFLDLGEPGQVTCDRAQITEALVNLLRNAAQAVDGRGRITLRSGREGDGSWVEVVDDGCGIPEELQERIFEPFYTTRPIGAGKGLGLSVAYNVVARHRGSLGVESRPGQGSRFRVWLPSEPPATTTAAPLDAPSEPR